MELLIVDDEVHIRTGLTEGVDWSSVGFDKVLSAGNGMEAWELFKRHSPAVVITDVRMPGLDGIELSRKILERTRDVRILILSGHADFDYAKRAMQLGVADYELKPAKIRNLLSFASSARESLLKERRESEDKRRLLFARWAQTVQQAQPQAGPEASYLALKPLIADPEKGYYRVLRIDLDRFQPDLPPAELFPASLLTAPPLDTAELLVGETSPGKYTLLCRSHASSGAPTDAQWLSWLERLDGHVRGRGPATISAGISTQGKAADLGRLAREAETACSLKITTGKGAKTVYSSALSGEVRGLSLVSAALSRDRELKEAICQADKLSAAKLLEDERVRLKRLVGLTPSHAAAWASDAVRLLVRTLEEMGIRFSERYGSTGSTATDLSEFDRLETLDDYADKLLRLYDAVLGELGERNGLRHSVSVRKAIEAVRSRYREELTVESMAEWIGITPNYFSHLFKKETGTAFREYVNEVRIAEAKRLLKTTNMLAYEITDQVGFPNYKHFCHVFKRSAGCSPSEYRRAGS
ncbi:response regulator [Cohnella ginsengisoli]|uniref:Response regulator n=1 Tax=Cohnella ginsengisoli TaxID=425004 RepID=A0A9X4QMR5_9BACL|nr:response regulator [Cohnella ginsengisoli]MDG0791557.1 response regulator [Cohnella ginsengisoli]